MAYQIEWSPTALEDVEVIAGYIARDSMSYAAAVIKKILDVTDELSKDPYSGKPVPEFDDKNVREFAAFSYRVIYRIKGEKITIASVIYKER
ncbi:MAG: type II toxin-antitoxin system RelE/ParE family toxin [Scytonematopsis contorta HA4267-MV1]|jgi:toxin ParE1/3/4|nr:type II toxin-antitoxin system RelE/ParE family toxin [Scytonematopsis contorta HA4267-MV1]